MKTIVTITGIRPDFIRMAKIFRLLDAHPDFRHILIHTGQHYDQLLSDVFFQDLQIRPPDYTLDTGISCTNHYEQLAYLAVKIPELFQTHQIHPDLIIFLGDSNTSAVAMPLKKAGYTICHIEAGMRSYDKRMLEEINRMVCDVCSDLLFVYHEDYRQFLAQENITNQVHVVGNTIVEICQEHSRDLWSQPKLGNLILVDIHRPENFQYPERLKAILDVANQCARKYQLPVKLLYFKRLREAIDRGQLDLGQVEMVALMPYKTYLETIYHCRFLISDSGTGQEEPALLKTPVIVPRDYTERPQSYQANCSFRLTLDSAHDDPVGGVNIAAMYQWLDDLEHKRLNMDTTWLGDGQTAERIVGIISEYLWMRDMTPLERRLRQSQPKYQMAQPFPHVVLDSALPLDLAKSIQEVILSLPAEQFDRYNNPFEQKLTLRDKYHFPTYLGQLFTYLTSPRFLGILSDLTGYTLVNDPDRNFWGVHKFVNGDKLDIHVDAGCHPRHRHLRKIVTLGIYLSCNWLPEYGGQLQLWEGSPLQTKLVRLVNSIDPQFNQIIIFTNEDDSWHGSPHPVSCPEEAQRIFVTLSYLTDISMSTSTCGNPRTKALFVGLPNEIPDPEKDRLRLLRADPEKYKEIYNLDKI